MTVMNTDGVEIGKGLYLKMNSAGTYYAYIQCATYKNIVSAIRII